MDEAIKIKQKDSLNLSTQEKEKGSSLNSKLKIVLVIAAVIGLIFIGKSLGLTEHINSLILRIDQLGDLGPIIYICLYIVCCLLFIPGSAMTLAGGLLWGVVKGSIIVSIASTIGAACSFLIGRYLARNWIGKKTESNENFKAVDEAIANEGWKIVGLLRLSPVFPFNFLNYSLGLTKVSFRDYILASWIGMMPGTIMFVYFGSLGRGVPTDNPLKTAFTIAGLIATVVVTVFITRTAKKALAQRVETK